MFVYIKARLFCLCTVGSSAAINESKDSDSVLVSLVV